MIKFGEKECSFQHAIVTMGTFDGVHLGHQKLLEKLRKRADKVGGEAVVLTYYHHPLEQLHKKTFPYLLTEKKRKEKILRNFGVDCVVYLNFTEKLATMTPEDFIQKVLINKLHIREIVVGYDTHFGKNRKGDYNLLVQKSKYFKYKVEVIEPFKFDNEIVSSSKIREFIRNGNICKATDFIGREYSVNGIVRSGKKIGRTLGFPTINIQPDDEHKLIPKNGVYATKTIIDGIEFFSVSNIGFSPTINTIHQRELESFIIDFSGELYGKYVELKFVKRLRDEIKFANRSQLIEAIKNDVAETNRIFGISNRL